MALVTVSNNSLTAVTALPASIPTGALTLIKSITASSSASISFVDGASGVVLDDTYKSYIFKFINIHPASNSQFYFNVSIDGGSNYNVAKTSTYFLAVHAEGDAESALIYNTTGDLAQGTGDQRISFDFINDNDSNLGGSMQLFSPADTTFVKHFICQTQHMQGDPASNNVFAAGYANTTSAINAVKFNMASGNIDSGIIKLYGVL